MQAAWASCPRLSGLAGRLPCHRAPAVRRSVRRPRAAPPQGSSDEIALLAAEFALLDAPLTGLAAAVGRGEARLIGEDELTRLAADVPDLRARLGLQCAPPPAARAAPGVSAGLHPCAAVGGRIFCEQQASEARRPALGAAAVSEREPACLQCCGLQCAHRRPGGPR
jgi:hypothetical protein